MKNSCLFMLVAILLIQFNSPLLGRSFQADPFDNRQEEAGNQEGGAEGDSAEEAKDEAPEQEPVAKPPIKIDDQLIQLELWDGSQISGKVQASTIPVETSFGRLDVPVGRIQKILPGLDSYPDLKQRIQRLVDSLADKDFDVRESAQRELLDMGLLVVNLLDQWRVDGTAEQKKRLGEIKTELLAMSDDLEESGEADSERILIGKDTIVTDEFTIVGTIDRTEFLLKTKFGDLQVTLADIKSGDRTVFGLAKSIRKTVKVAAEAFFQREPANTRIRLKRGDRVSIRASGNVRWTNWNQTSTPTGLSGQGNYQGINSGTLVARIGPTGKLIKIGDKADFIASGNGTLYLGIAIQDNYANQSSYRWTGSYSAKVVVEPK